ncbi:MULTISPECIES: hypothetical protein [unclassified Chryseobacterium]|uniref:hypothetical protein n=1 Tax=unclassified Chryseobacterium TaxID=2593645 RepID=UPI000F450128|nr:hypothetical protein [Chryseobacterium sp. G0240]ROI02162.1 hypothetical protein EGI16_14890 [Chryseobacterium sp. G0240]
MKTIPILLFLFVCSNYSSQTLLSLYGPGLVPSNNSVISSKRPDKLTYDEIEGSAYFEKQFSMASVSPNYEDVLIRYNIYNDEVEFKKNEDVMVLPKTDTFSRIIFRNSKNVLVLLDSTGYYFEIVKGKYTLYKKLRTKFIDFVPAPTPYQADKPAMFRNLEPVYYIKVGDNLIGNFKSTKDLISQLPDKETLNSFLKSNKIKADKEEDLIRLVNFLNQQ